MDHFELVSPFEPMGDQPQAIEELTQGLKKDIWSKRFSAQRDRVRPSPWRRLLKGKQTDSCAGS